MSQSPKDVSPERRAELSQGKDATKHLAEWLAVDLRQLVRSALPALGWDDRLSLVMQRMDGARKQTTPALTQAVGEALSQSGDLDLAPLLAHPSDMVRSWGPYVAVAQGDSSWPALLERLRPFADDPHFGVREIAWMALRPRVAADTATALEHLTPWTAEESDNLRRFAAEVTRPRGVWCAHLAALKERPEMARPLLDPLHADASVYVRKSVGNWLNDAGKTRPDWVRDLVADWRSRSDGAATKHILRLAERNLKA